MWGVVPKSSTNQFQIPLRDVLRLPFDHFLFGMVTCHSITVLNGIMMGDPLDLKIFQSTGWSLEDSKNIPEEEKYGTIYPIILRQPKSYINDLPESNVSTGREISRQSSVEDLLATVGLTQAQKHFDHGIVREFPFTSALQRMSVITRCLSAHLFNVYTKGSPEMIKQLCKPQSLPEGYSQQLSIFAKKGYRIIAIAFKSLDPKVNYTKIQRFSREDVENDLEFLGFVILENRLKPDTSEVINTLNTAKIRTIMITGDNILTAISVARDCGIVNSSQAVITVHADPVNKSEHNYDDSNGHNIKMSGDQNRQYKLQYTLDTGSNICASYQLFNNGNGNLFLPESTVSNCSVESHMNLPRITSKNSIENDCNKSYNESIVNLSNSLASVETTDTWTHNDTTDVHVELETNIMQENKWQQQYTFAMDGKTWQILKDHFPEQLGIILTRGSIYARMSPEQKQALVMELQNLDYCVAMCGDGANDCGALKAAHAGISLSETESSIASPFTSNNSTISSVIHVIKEGRAALVTSFGIFKYMAAYSLVQFISVMILYSIDSNLTDKQYLYVDLGLISIFAFFFGKTESYDGNLVNQVPLSSLISLTPLSSLLLHLATVTIFQVTGRCYLVFLI